MSARKKGTKKELTQALKNIVGDKYVYDDPATLWSYSKDASPLPPALPEVVVQPGSTEEVLALVAYAHRSRTPLYPRSSGSNLWGGCIPIAGGAVVDLSRMNRILSIDPEFFSCTMEPAVTFIQLQGALSKFDKGYYNLVSPEGGYASCIAGSFLAHGDGIGSALFGTQGDAVIGCKMVIPPGEIVATGSAANPRAAEVAGGSGQFFRYAYAHDLTGLFCGSEGTLGILVEVTVKIELLPERLGFAAFDFDRVEDACVVLYKARQARILAQFAALRERASMEAVIPGEHPVAQLIYIISGDNAVVEYQLDKLRTIANENNGREADPKKAEAYWEKRFSLVPGAMYKLGSRALLPLHYPLGKMGWYYGKIKEICDEIIAKKYRLPYFIGGFQVDTAFVCYPVIMYLEQYPEQYDVMRQCTLETQKALLDLGGAPIQIGRLWAGSMRALGTHFELVKRIKRAIDPHNIMSPGLLDLEY